MVKLLNKISNLRFINSIINKINVDYLIICLIGLHSFFWYKGNLMYLGGDYGIPLNAFSNMAHLFTWKEQLGGVESWNLTLFFHYSLFAILKFFKLNIVWSQRVYIYIMHTLSGISMYYLAASFKSTSRISKLIAALFYMINPFMMGMVLIPTFIPYHLTPLAIGFFVRAVYKNNLKIRYLLFSVLTFLCMVGDLPNYKHVSVAVIIIFIFALYQSFLRKENKFYPIKIFILFMIFMLALTLWFVVPYMSLLLNSTVTEMLSDHGVGVQFGDYGYATVSSLLRLLGSGSFQEGGLPCASVYFDNFFMVFCGYLVACFAFLAVALRSKCKDVLFFAVIAVAFIFLAKGTNPPLGFLYKFFVCSIPLARVFRTSWSLLFGVSIAYSFLIGAFTEEIYQRIRKTSLVSKKVLSNFFIIFIITIICINSWPLITGHHLQSIYNPPTYQGVTIPQYYFDAENYLSLQKGDFRFLKLPPTDSGYIFTTWNYGGSNLIPFIFSKPYIDGFYLNNASRPLLKQLYRSIKNKDLYQLNKILGLFNIRYVLIDRTDKTYQLQRKENIENWIKEDTNLTKIKSFGDIDIYQNNKFMPHIYAGTKAVLIHSQDSYLKELGVFNYINPMNVLIYKDNPKDISSLIPSVDELIFTPLDKNNVSFLEINNRHLHRLIVNYLISFPEGADSYEKKYLRLFKGSNFYLYSVASNANYPISLRLLGENKVIDTNFFQRFDRFKNNNHSVNFKKPLYLGALRIPKDLYCVDSSDEDVVGFLADAKTKSINPDSKIFLKYLKVNPTRYRIFIKPQRSFWLVFGESFHRCWRAYAYRRDRNFLFPKKVRLILHNKVNVFANGWYFDLERISKELGGDRGEEYEIVIEYLPQKLFYIMLFVSLFCLFIIIAYSYKYERKNAA